MGPGGVPGRGGGTCIQPAGPDDHAGDPGGGGGAAGPKPNAQISTEAPALATAPTTKPASPTPTTTPVE